MPPSERESGVAGRVQFPRRAQGCGVPGTHHPSATRLTFQPSTFFREPPLTLKKKIPTLNVELPNPPPSPPVP